MRKRKLTPKQAAFVDAYIASLNATEAALKAGYSKKTAYSIGGNLLKNPAIQAALQERMASVASDRIASMEEVLQTITSIMRGAIDEEVVASAGSGPGKMEPVVVKKKASIRDRLKAAELLARRYGLDKPDGDENEGEVTIVDDTGTAQ